METALAHRRTSPLSGYTARDDFGGCSIRDTPDAALQPKPRVHGRAEIGYGARLVHLYQRNPLRVLFPTPPADDVATAVLITTSGGLVGGDRIEIAVTLEAGARLHVTTQAAEKVYRSAGEDVRIEVALEAGAEAWLEYLPPETILFEGARLRRRTEIGLAPGARFLGGEILVFGRIARGERLTRGLVHDAWALRSGGRLIWADALHLDGEIDATMAAPASFDGAAASAMLIYAAPDALAYRDGVRAVIAASGVRGGATLIGEVLLMRWLAADPARLRRAYAEAAGWLRRAAAGLPDILPRLWHV